MDAWTEEELDFYNSLYQKSEAKFSTFVESGTLLHNYAHIFDLLSSLRQACNHPYLVLVSKNATLVQHSANDPHNDQVTQTAYSATRLATLGAFDSSKCCICNTSITSNVQQHASTQLTQQEDGGHLNGAHLNASSGVVSKCGHHFHRHCVLELLSCCAPAPAPAATPLNPPRISPRTAQRKKRAASTAQEGLLKASSKAPVAKCPACHKPLSVDMRNVASGFRTRNARAPTTTKSLLRSISAQQVCHLSSATCH